MPVTCDVCDRVMHEFMSMACALCDSYLLNNTTIHTHINILMCIWHMTHNVVWRQSHFLNFAYCHVHVCVGQIIEKSSLVFLDLPSRASNARLRIT